MGKMLKILCVSLCATSVACTAPEFKNDLEKNSYAIGANVARKLKLQGVTFDPVMLSKGALDEMNGKSLLTESEVEALLQNVRQVAQEKIMDEQKKKAEENKQRGTAFLTENGKKEGVITLPSGVQYRVLQAGNGATPNDVDTVLCNYRGTLVDGTVFDSGQPGEPTYFEVNKVISGWREALTQMPVGSKWELVIPSEMAYGERGAAPAIGPNETLIFEVELVSIE